MPIEILAPKHRPDLERTIRACGSFTPEEVACGLQLADLALAGSPDYEWFVCRGGYLCVGSASLADRVFELFWIWVDPEARGRGVGGRLMEHFDELCRERGQRMGLIHTSSTYASARRLYERHGFRVAARINDFYRLGDDLMVYRKDYV